MTQNMDRLISSIIGIILGACFAIFINYNNYLYKGPNSNIIKKQLYEQNGKCYKLEPVVHICPINKSML